MQILARTGHPDFLDLPWSEPLEEWRHERLVQVVRGISRHVVRFVEYEGAVYALKELPAALARREYGLLRHLGAEGMPVVDGVGVVTERGGSTSHFASLARERDIPMVLGVADATRRIPDGAQVAVDGVAGIVRWIA